MSISECSLTDHHPDIKNAKRAAYKRKEAIAAHMFSSTGLINFQFWHDLALLLANSRTYVGLVLDTGYLDPTAPIE